MTKIDLEAVNRRTRTKCQLHKNFKIFENNISPEAERMRQVKVKGKQQKRICHMFIYRDSCFAASSNDNRETRCDCPHSDLRTKKRPTQ